MNPERYQELWQLIALFGEDYDLFGDSIEEITLSYKKDCTPDLINKIVHQIDQFTLENEGKMDSAFIDYFGHQCSPALWEHNTASFLGELKNLLNNTK